MCKVYSVTGGQLKFPCNNMGEIWEWTYVQNYSRNVLTCSKGGKLTISGHRYLHKKGHFSWKMSGLHIYNFLYDMKQPEEAMLYRVLLFKEHICRHEIKHKSTKTQVASHALSGTKLSDIIGWFVSERPKSR